jgi:hypothetical protein
MKPKIVGRRMTLEQFMGRVDKILRLDCGWGVNDLPDYCYMDSYKANDTPAECARDVIKNAQGY